MIKEVLQEKRYLDFATYIVKTEINLAGGCACSEAWFYGAEKQHLAFARAPS